MAETAEPQLRLRPFRGEDAPHLERLLGHPRLARRTLPTGVQELHPLAWTAHRRTFVVYLDRLLIGACELLRDEDDEAAWELSVVLDRRERVGDGARCAAAILFYAFEIMKAESVWFWVPTGNTAVERFAERLHFTSLHQVRLPSGLPADVFELSDGRWRSHGQDAVAGLLQVPVELCDGRHRWSTRGGWFEAA